MDNGWFRNVPQIEPQQPYVWPADLPLEPDRTAESGPDLTHEFSVFDEHEPKHEAPKRTGRRIVAGVPWALAVAAMVVALVARADPFGATTPTYPSPTAQPAPKPLPAVTRTVRVTPPAVTLHAAPRPAETVYATATVTKTAAPKPAATVTVTTTKTVTAEPEQAPAVPGE